jgi:hypothetical protein
MWLGRVLGTGNLRIGSLHLPERPRIMKPVLETVMMTGLGPGHSDSELGFGHILYH